MGTGYCAARCGVVCCGVVRCGVVWCGEVWCGEMCCAVLCCAVLYIFTYIHGVRCEVNKEVSSYNIIYNTCTS